MKLTITIPDHYGAKLQQLADLQAEIEQQNPSAEKYPGLEGVAAKVVITHLRDAIKNHEKAIEVFRKREDQQ